MRIAISGASGFVGSHLSKMFAAKGYQIVPLNRAAFQNGAEDGLCNTIAGCDVVINLAGISINHRWSRSYKKKMYESRIGVTQKLVAAINSLEVKPKLLISASAVGYYPSTGCFDEYSSAQGDGFLAKLCVDWELESQKVSPDIRLVNARFAVILSLSGGALPKMVKPARFGLAVAIGRGRQAFPWIGLEDHGRAIEYIVQHPEIEGGVNLVAPQQINNREFTKVLAKHFKSFLTLSVPQFIFKLVMGESAELITRGQCVKPTKLIESGFIFKHSTIEDFFINTGMEMLAKGR